MTPSRSRNLVVLAMIALFLGAAPVHGQAPQPEWVDITSPQKLVVKTSEVAGGTVRIRGGLLIRPGFKALFGAKSENMKVDLFLDILNRSPNTLWVEMEIEVPGQQESVKLVEIKTGRRWWQTWDVKELQWDFHYPVKVSLYPDKKKTSPLGSISASLVFEQAEKAKLEEANALAAKEWRKDRFTWVTLSGWPEKVPPVAVESAEEMVEGTVVDALLQGDIAKMIQTLETADHPGCEFQIVKQWRSAGKSGLERWEVRNCDSTSMYDVSMIPAPNGGTDFRVRKTGPEIAQTAAATPPARAQRSVRQGKPPFEWDWKNSCVQCTLIFEEKTRLKISGMPTKGTTVESELRATGFSAEEELSLWRKVQDGSYTEFPAALTPEGVLRMLHKGQVLPTSVTFGGFVMGEALQLALHSNTTGKSTFAKVILFPIEAQAAGGCAVSAELQSPDGYAFVITFRGFTEGEEVEVVSLYKKEQIPHALKPSKRGEFSLPVMFGPGDKGKARISAKGKACQVSLEYKIGKDALVVQ